MLQATKVNLISQKHFRFFLIIILFVLGEFEVTVEVAKETQVHVEDEKRQEEGQVCIQE